MIFEKVFLFVSIHLLPSAANGNHMAAICCYIPLYFYSYFTSVFLPFTM